jgi:hypothetical protein
MWRRLKATKLAGTPPRVLVEATEHICDVILT